MLRGLWMALLGSALVSCALSTEEEAWWLGTEEPSRGGAADDGSEPQLTIFLSGEQTDIRTILEGRSLGPLGRHRTGHFSLDGRAISDSVILVIDGEIHRYDGQVDRHLLVVQPRYYSHEEGAANEAGFLRVDFKRSDRIRVIEQEGAPFATAAGVFRGDILAIDSIGLHDELDEDLYSYYIRPARFYERPPNLLRDVTLYIRPNVAVTRLSPEPSCAGFPVLDRTLSETPLRVEVAAEGFPEGADVDLQVIYRVPVTAASSFMEHLWDYVAWTVIDEDETSLSRRATSQEGLAAAPFPTYTTDQPEWGARHFSMEIEVRATSGNIAAATFSHRLDVIEGAEQVVVDAFELCPLDDESCHRFRDEGEAENVRARRAVVEATADDRGHFARVMRPIGRCTGGDAVSGEFADDCRVYRESRDSELTTRVAAELNFELTVDGEAQGGGSWGGSYFGIASGEIEAAFKASFGLEVELDASFETSYTWRNRHSLDVIYDPSSTQLQWWRVIQPRVRYLEVAEFDQCGMRVVSHDFFLTDLRDSRLVIACEEVPAFDSICHAVEPSVEAAEACNELLIAPDSDRGRECLAE